MLHDDLVVKGHIKKQSMGNKWNNTYGFVEHENVPNIICIAATNLKCCWVSMELVYTSWMVK